MRITFTMPNAKEIVQSIHGKVMGIVTTTTMCAGVTGTAEIAVDIAIKDINTITARNVSV